MLISHSPRLDSPKQGTCLMLLLFLFLGAAPSIMKYNEKMELIFHFFICGTFTVFGTYLVPKWLHRIVAIEL